MRSTREKELVDNTEESPESNGDRNDPVHNKQPSPTSYAVTSIQARVQTRLQVTTEHTGYRFDLQEDSDPFGKLLGAIPAAEQCNVTRESASFEKPEDERREGKSVDQV